MRCISSGGLIDFSSYFICLSKRTLKKKGHRSSMTLAEFFLEKFIPRREMQSISSRGPIVFTYTLFGLVNEYWTFKNQYGFLSFWNLENVHVRMGWDGVGRYIRSVLQFTLYFVGI